MDILQPLTKDSTLHSIVEYINELVRLRNETTDVVSSLTSVSVGEKKVYTSSDSVFITGETFTAPTTGQYQLSITGTGTSRFVVLSALTGEELLKKEVINAYTSDVLFLSAGDKFVIYASSNTGYTLAVTINMVSSLYNMIYNLQKSYDLMVPELQSINQLLQDTSEQYNTLLERSDVIMNNYTSQINLLQQDNLALLQRIETLENA